MKKDQDHHFQGHRFLMLFDSSGPVQTEILRTLKSDPRVIRSYIQRVCDRDLDPGTSLDRARR